MPTNSADRTHPEQPAPRITHVSATPMPGTDLYALNIAALNHEGKRILVRFTMEPEAAASARRLMALDAREILQPVQWQHERHADPESEIARLIQERDELGRVAMRAQQAKEQADFTARERERDAAALQAINATLREDKAALLDALSGYVFEREQITKVEHRDHAAAVALLRRHGVQFETMAEQHEREQAARRAEGST